VRWRAVFGGIVIAAILAGCSGQASESRLTVEPTAASDGIAPLALAGTLCRELSFVLPADAAAVRPAVPARFLLVGEEAGRAFVVVSVTACKGLAVAGAPPVPAIVSEVGVEIVSPSADGARHAYLLWHATDAPTLQRALESRGVRAALVPDMTFTAASPIRLLATEVTASVPWSDGAYDLHALAAAPLGPTTLMPSTWWHEGVHGLLSVHSVYEAASLATVEGTLRGATEGPLQGENGAVGALVAYAFNAELLLVT
jgi:hypothetical protein